MRETARLTSRRSRRGRAARVCSATASRRARICSRRVFRHASDRPTLSSSPVAGSPGTSWRGGRRLWRTSRDALRAKGADPAAAAADQQLDRGGGRHLEVGARRWRCRSLVEQRCVDRALADDGGRSFSGCAASRSAAGDGPCMWSRPADAGVAVCCAPPCSAGRCSSPVRAQRARCRASIRCRRPPAAVGWRSRGPGRSSSCCRSGASRRSGIGSRRRRGGAATARGLRRGARRARRQRFLTSASRGAASSGRRLRGRHRGRRHGGARELIRESFAPSSTDRELPRLTATS